MKKILFIYTLCFVALNLAAEDTISVTGTIPVPDSIAVQTPRTNLLDSMSGVQVIQDSAMFKLLELAMFGQKEMIEIDGFRVQIYSSNQQQTAKGEALTLETNLKNRVSQTIYVVYIPPFWKVRIGDFRTYDEALEYKKSFVQDFPNMTGDTYIVRDKIKIMP